MSNDKNELRITRTLDGGNLDCGNGLLLLIRKAIDPLEPGEFLRLLSTEVSVDEDLPAWCRLTKNELVKFDKSGQQRTFLIRKGPGINSQITHAPDFEKNTEDAPSPSTNSAPDLSIPPLSVMGIGSWPRPAHLIVELHKYLEGKIPEHEFQQAANHAIALCIDAQLSAGVDVVTDGELRRDNYSSFVANILNNCQLIPISDLLHLVDEPENFAKELDMLDVPSSKVRHPAIIGPISRTKPLAVKEYLFARTKTAKPIKVALPGPYLLTRTMWMKCIAERWYRSREALGDVIVEILRQEIAELLSAGVAIIQLDEPVLTEIVFASPNNTPKFMCGTLSERSSAKEELAKAQFLLQSVLAGFPRDRLALHVCRGNWTTDEKAALSGDYYPLLSILGGLEVGTLFLEFCTPRAGTMSILKEFSKYQRVGLGVVNPKHAQVESVEQIYRSALEACNLIGPERLYLNPDCGFATFADSPVSAPEIAGEKLANIAKAASRLRSEFQLTLR